MDVSLELELFNKYFKQILLKDTYTHLNLSITFSINK